MASKKDGRKRTFGQKAGRFVRRFTLCAAFAAAAGAGYNYYGTQQDVTTKVTSVEPSPQGQMVHTDQGNFINATTWAYQKDDGDVRAISDALKPGAEVKLHVYGAQPQLGGFTAHDLGLYQNITGVTVLAPPPAPEAQPQPPRVVQALEPVVAAPAPIKAAALVAAPPLQTAGVLTVPSSLVNTTGVDVEVTSTPEACAANDDFNAVSANIPRIARDLDIMRQLPLTGVPVFNVMKDPANKMQTCEFPVDPTKGSTSSYRGNQAHVGRGTGTSTTFHEYFHATQDVDSKGVNMFFLTEKDAVVANLLTEASAVAYELASRQEAANHGLKFYDPPDFTRTWVEGDVIHTQEYVESAPATNPDNRKVFSDAYNASFDANTTLDAQAREAAALQAGGQAIVRRLMQGEDDQWNAANTSLVIDNINKNLDAFDADPEDASYVSTRDHVYGVQGQLPTNINFVPPEYFGAGASKAIDQAFTDLHFQWKPVTPATSTPPATDTPAPAPGAKALAPPPFVPPPTI